MESLEKLIASFSSQNSISFFRQKIASFKPVYEDFTYSLNAVENELFSEVQKIGEATINKSEDLLVFTAQFSGNLSERTSKRAQFDLAKKILKQDFKDGAIFIFYDVKGNFRFSFIRRNYGDKTNKFTNWKRYTYFINPEYTNNTFKDRIEKCSFDSLDHIQEAFSVEKLNKDFYQKISKAFYSLIGGKVKINSKEIDFSSSLQLPSVTDRKIHQEFAVRLVGRTIFCWFLKNKKSESGLSLLPEGWLSSKVVAEVNNDQHNYYHSILEKLFFEVLNQKIEERIPNLPSGHENIPYLNGGLFEPTKEDFYEYEKTSGVSKFLNTLKIPNSWFIDFFEVLEQYNFTIDENSINDSEVSIDPEMLGTIFENLLAEIDPDTEKSARKSTGSFYTPREIVDYMVEQSLVQYLKTKTEIDDEEKLQTLFSDDEENLFTDKEANVILKAISEVKILDPACGSGAFPMGALHKIVKLLQKLDKGAIWWKKKQLEKARNLDSKYFNQFKEKLENANSDYARKLGVIQHSIYGVDIQPIAAEISKLRSFLSLIIDENIDDNAENRGIEPLPNLEFKFVTANTLIGLDEGVSKNTGSVSTGTLDFGETEDLQYDLQVLRNAYLQANPKEKLKLRKDFENLQTKIYKQETKDGRMPSKRAMQLSSWKPFSHHSSSWFDPEWMFGVEKFDVVIGNPPWGSKLSIKEKETYKTIYEEIDSSTPNSFAYFCGNGLNLSNMVLTFVLPDSILLKDFSKTRNLFKDNLTNISWYLNTGIPENFRPFVHVEHDVCVLIVNKKLKPNVCEISKYEYDFGLKNSVIQNYSVLKDNFILSEHAYNYNLLIRDKEIELYNKLCPLERLNSKVQIHEGIHTGNARDILFHDKKINSNCKPLFYGGRAGDFIENFHSRRSKWFVDYRNDIIDKGKGFYASLRDERIFNLPKLYITRTGNPIKVFYDDNNYASNNFFSLQMKDYNLNSEDILKSILPLLLSSFSNFYIRTFCAPRLGDTFVETKIIHLLKIPIPKLLFSNVEIQKKFKDIVNEIINEKINNTNADISSLTTKIDFMIYKLYELTYDEVLIVDPEFGLSEQEYEAFTV